MSKRTPTFLAVSIASMLLCVAPYSWANDSGNNFDFDIKLGIAGEYNSNVTVSEIDTSVDEADMATVLDFSIDAYWQPAESWNLDFGYQLTDRRYRDYGEFDLMLHLLFADVSYDFAVYTLGGNYYYADANLGGSSFLSLNQYSVYAARMIGDAVYLRGAYNQAEKSLAAFPERDADTQGFSIDAFYFFNAGKSFLLFGGNFDDEKARSDMFSYQGSTLRLRYSHRFTWLNQDARFQVGYRIHERDYRGDALGLQQPREDRHNVLDARFEVPVWQRLMAITQLEHGDYQSNLASADYSETRISLGVALHF